MFVPACVSVRHNHDSSLNTARHVVKICLGNTFCRFNAHHPDVSVHSWKRQRRERQRERGTEKASKCAQVNKKPQRCSLNCFAQAKVSIQAKNTELSVYLRVSSPYRCPDAASRAPGSHPPADSCSNLTTTLARQRTSLYNSDFHLPRHHHHHRHHHFPPVRLPATVRVLCSNCRAPFSPVEYMCCVFLSFSLPASLRPLSLLPHNKPCSCFPAVFRA